MQCLSLNTRKTPPRLRQDHWAAINRQYFGALDILSMAPDPCESQLRIFTLNDLRASLIDAPAHRVNRGSGKLRDALDDSFKLLFQLQGASCIQTDQQEVRLVPGGWGLYDPREPYSVHNLERTSLLVLQIPRDRLPEVEGARLYSSVSAGGMDGGMSGLLGVLLRSLCGQLPDLRDDAGVALSETILGLLNYTLSSGGDMAPEHPALPAVLKARVRDYVRRNLSDPDLTLDRIADAMRCSKRYLHHVFQDESQTLDRQIWDARLEHARVRLAGAAPQQTIADICFGSGFRSSAHFCRLFKEKYQASPSDYRRRRGGGV